MKKYLTHSEIQMKNYIGFRAGRTLGRKKGGVITYIKATEAVDAGLDFTVSHRVVGSFGGTK